MVLSWTRAQFRPKPEFIHSLLDPPYLKIVGFFSRVYLGVFKGGGVQIPQSYLSRWWQLKYFLFSPQGARLNAGKFLQV